MQWGWVALPGAATGPMAPSPPWLHSLSWALGPGGHRTGTARALPGAEHHCLPRHRRPQHPGIQPESGCLRGTETAGSCRTQSSSQGWLGQTGLRRSGPGLEPGTAARWEFTALGHPAAGSRLHPGTGDQGARESPASPSGPGRGRGGSALPDQTVAVPAGRVCDSAPPSAPQPHVATVKRVPA